MDDKKTKRYRLTVSREQLDLIVRCVEDCHRFMAGQLEMENTICRCDGYREIRDELRKLHGLVVPELNAVYGPTASYPWSGGDCPNEAQRKFIASTYYLYREILHRLRVERTKNENADKLSYSVYDNPTLTCDESGDTIFLEILDGDD